MANCEMAGVVHGETIPVRSVFPVRSAWRAQSGTARMGMALVVDVSVGETVGESRRQAGRRSMVASPLVVECGLMDGG